MFFMPMMTSLSNTTAQPIVTTAEVRDAFPSVSLAGSWKIAVSKGSIRVGKHTFTVKTPTELSIDSPQIQQVTDERHDSVGTYNPAIPAYWNGVRFGRLIAAETTAPDLLVPGSVVVKSGPGKSIKFTEDKDYNLSTQWAAIARISDGAIKDNQPVWIDYRYVPGRIDAIIVDHSGTVSVVSGTSEVTLAKPPTIPEDSVAIANVWIPGPVSALTTDDIYPVIEPHYVEPQASTMPEASTLLPKIWAALHDGKPLHILAWGDSITYGVGIPENERLQDQFVAMLQARFPKAKITLTTEAWGGHKSTDFLAEPAGSQHNFQEKVLDPHPDLILMEFANDALLTPDQLQTTYSHLLQQFKQIGAECIMITPHPIWPPWMGTTSTRFESDPRPYIAFLHTFVESHHIALADASARWLHLDKQGIPYMTLLINALNHPDERGYRLYALALMQVFGGKDSDSSTA